ncbi:MAG: porin family protein [Blastocatellia bacterium]|nr:porin family protein [Blastocatellia bacterium]
MIKQKTLFAGMLAAMLFASISLAQEVPKSEVSVQGLGSFTSDTTGRGVRQHTTDSGGVLASYRYHFNRWFGADGSYGYTRNTQQNFSTGGFSLGSTQSNMHQITGALVVTLPEKILLFRPFVLAGGGVLNFSPTGNNFFSGTPLSASGQNKGAFVYGAGTDVDLSNHFAIRVEYRGLVYDRPDFGFTFLNSGRTTHTAQPSAGFVFRF